MATRLLESLTTQQLLCLLSSTPQQLQSGSKGLEDPWRATGLQSTLEAEEADSSTVAVVATE